MPGPKILAHDQLQLGPRPKAQSLGVARRKPIHWQCEKCNRAEMLVLPCTPTGCGKVLFSCYGCGQEYQIQFSGAGGACGESIGMRIG